MERQFLDYTLPAAKAGLAFGSMSRRCLHLPGLAAFVLACLTVLPVSAGAEVGQVHDQGMEASKDEADSCSLIAKQPEADKKRLIWDLMRENFGVPESRSTHQKVRVRKWLQRYLDPRTSLKKELEGSRDYLYTVVRIVNERGLPAELALLPFLESSYRPTIKSSIGAYGLWQFMPTTATAYGLNRSWFHDERGDIERSTHVALNYLVKLKNRFNNDWLYAVAAYNYGQGSLSRKIRQSRKDATVWDLDLPEETVNHLAKWIALSRIILRSEEFDFELPEIYNVPTYCWITFSDQVDFDMVAEMARRDLDRLWPLNPEIEQLSTPIIANEDGTYKPHRIRIPIDEAKHYAYVAENFEPFELRERKVVEVHKHDTLEKLAGQHGTRGTTIRVINGLSSSTIYPGNRLEIPRRRTKDEPSSDNCLEHVVEAGDTIWSVARGWNTRARDVAWDSQIGIREELQVGDILRYCKPKTRAGRVVSLSPMTHTVAQGDTLSVIARRFFISIDQLMQANDISDPNALAVGQTLVIPK